MGASLALAVPLLCWDLSVCKGRQEMYGAAIERIVDNGGWERKVGMGKRENER